MPLYACVACSRDRKNRRLFGGILPERFEDRTDTHDQAVRLLDNFFTIIETQCGRDTRVIIGGMGREHEKSADEFAMLVMDVLEVRREHFYPQISLALL